MRGHHRLNIQKLRMASTKAHGKSCGKLLEKSLRDSQLVKANQNMAIVTAIIHIMY